jgi:hypothetical protein
MPKRLAITVAGAVSLGSFEAGVLFEVLSAIKQHNQDSRTTDQDRIEVDVLTGASAGGMTATIAAQKLLFDSSALDGAYRNSFYRPWVVDVNLEGLLALQPGEDPTHSILSSNFVEDISKKYLTQRYQSHAPLTIASHPAAAKTIRLGLALSNLNGVNYAQATHPNGSFNYTRYQDEIDAVASPDAAHDNEDFWEPLRNAAVSCGAFPFAFRMKELYRHKSEYPDADQSEFPSDVETFIYTDGGVFQNEPLGMAKNFVDEIDKHLNSDSRFYLFVSPGIRSSTVDLTFNQKVADYKAAAGALAMGVFQQARFHDWITAEGVNAKVDLFNQRALGLQSAILKNEVSAQNLSAVADQLLPLFFDPSNPTQVNNQAAAVIRLKNQFSKEYAVLAKANPASAEAWIKSILVFETAADLGARDEMYICSITAAPSELASSGVSAFLGFFDQSYRDHDYDVGRMKAQLFLNQPPGNLGPIRWKPAEDIRKIDSNLDGLTLDKVDRGIREQFRDRLRSRAHDILAEMGVPTALIRETIDLAFIRPQLNKLLKL